MGLLTVLKAVQAVTSVPNQKSGDTFRHNLI